MFPEIVLRYLVVGTIQLCLLGLVGFTLKRVYNKHGLRASVLFVFVLIFSLEPMLRISYPKFAPGTRINGERIRANSVVIRTWDVDKWVRYNKSNYLYIQSVQNISEKELLLCYKLFSFDQSPLEVESTISLVGSDGSMYDYMAGQENLSIFYRAGIMEFTAQNHLVTGEPLFIYIDGQRIKLN